MADDSDKKQHCEPSLIESRPPTPMELGALQVIHKMTDRIVLVPVVFNGEPRYALALLGQENGGEQYVQILATLLLPTDEVLDSRGGAGYNKTPPPKKDMN